MAGFKVSYKILGKQAEEIKAAAKMIDGYTAQIEKIGSALGNYDMLDEIRINLAKLTKQFEESYFIMSAAGELLEQILVHYSELEKRQLKKIESTKALNRNFYKRSVPLSTTITI
jgi:tRNA U34 2-thiouridine synthase MnmA/TrmU